MIQTCKTVRPIYGLYMIVFYVDFLNLNFTLSINDGPFMADWAKCAAAVKLTSKNDICNRYQHCNSGESQAESSLMMVYVNQNMLEQIL